MIPLRDNIPSGQFPIVNYVLIAICGIVFLFQLADQRDHQDEMVERYGMIPVRVLHPNQPVEISERVLVQTPLGEQVAERAHTAESPPFSPWLTLFTCIFLHGGWLHILGNLWFLHIFGDNVESRLGHVAYLFFYGACGVVASATHLLSAPESAVPTIGASGAIAGVMGAYLFFYPRAMVVTLFPIFFFWQIVVVPAPVFLGIWFLMQFFAGAFSITGVATEGVAWWAHIGGFLTGAAVAYRLERTGYLRPRVDVIRPNTDRMRMYRYQR